METSKQFKRVPFNIELAKKIQAGEIEGRIVAENIKGILFPIRIICYDAKNMFSIVGLALDPNGNEYTIMFGKSGTNLDDVSIHIELPEEAPKHEFKVGDKVRIHYPEDMLRDYLYLGCYQDKIVEVKRIVEGIETVLVVSNDELKEDSVNIEFVYPVETEKCEIKTLEHKSYTFKPFDKVLVRDNPTQEWICTLLSSVKDDGDYPIYLSICNYPWLECIPYEGNEHLVGTIDKPKKE